jgi:GNAT superfamily N-acetyltransferase
VRVSSGITVRRVVGADRPAWLEMWQAYCAFYETSVPQRVTDSTWQRILARDSAIHSILAVRMPGEEALGFANYVVHPFTWSERSACYLEDLFVHPQARGCGVGRALIDDLIARCDRHRWARLYWMTRESNAPARRLYERFAQPDDFVRYTVERDALADT